MNYILYVEMENDIMNHKPLNYWTAHDCFADAREHTGLSNQGVIYL